MARHLRLHLIALAVASCTACYLLTSYGQTQPPATPVSSTQGAPAWGESVNGLQIALTEISTAEAKQPQFEVLLRNVGEKDLTVNLGMMLGNGKVQLPERIRLSLTDASGKTRQLLFADKRFPGIAGRVDDYVVPLRVGSTYSLRVGLDQFWSPQTKETTLKLEPSQYHIIAEHEGSGATYVNRDMPGVKLLSFWQGKVQSQPVSISIA